MHYTNIICLDDLFREEFWPAKNFFYDLIREPIFQACGINIQASPRNHFPNNLANSFDPELFFKLCSKNESAEWNMFYNSIPPASQEYIINSIPTNSLVISYEMPPWLEKTLVSANIDFIDIRISPLRFARDLYIALYSNSPILRTNLQQFVVSIEEIKLEASLVSASIKHLRRYQMTDNLLEKTIIYIGQTEHDASLIDEKGDFIRIAYFEKELKEIIGNKKILYKPHPNADKFSMQEKQNLEKILNQPIELCNDNIYELFGSDDLTEFIGLSSGSLQEAVFFGKKAYVLYKPICAIDENINNFYSQIRFEDFISPFFWHQLICTHESLPKVLKLPSINQNELRHLHNVWWGYSEYLLQYQQKDFLEDSFKFNPAARQIQEKVDTIERKLNIIDFYLKPIKKFRKILKVIFTFFTNQEKNNL